MASPGKRTGLGARNPNLYTDKLVLAPMVRVGTLPMRLMCLEYGADLVYSPEIVDKRLIECTRRVDERTGCILYERNGHVSFSTHPREKSRLILQLGTADAALALEAALHAREDVSGVDVNCGCPKKFSMQGGMGAALLEDPEKLEGILRTLVEGLDIPVTCKIRLLPEQAATLSLVRRLAATGISALAVHCRTKTERPRDPAHWDRLREVVEAVAPLPVIVNGDVLRPEHVARVREMTGASSVMIARGAQDNPSIFQTAKDPAIPLVGKMDLVQRLLRLATRIDNVFPNTKYILMLMYTLTKSETFVSLQRSKTYTALCQTFNVEYEEPGLVYPEEMSKRAVTPVDEDRPEKKVKLDEAPINGEHPEDARMAQVEG